MNTKIVKASARHKDFIKEIYKQEKKHLGSFNLYQSWDKYLLGQSPYKFFVIEEVGFMRYGFSKKYKSYLLQEIGIKEEHKKKGYAKILLNAIPKPLMLKCNFDNDAGNFFYEKCGMTKVGKTQTKNGVKQNIWAW